MSDRNFSGFGKVLYDIHKRCGLGLEHIFGVLLNSEYPLALTGFFDAATEAGDETTVRYASRLLAESPVV